MSATRPFAIVTGASTGIGFELAKRCADEGYDLLIAADELEIEKAAASLRSDGVQVEALQADLATTEGVDKLYAAAATALDDPGVRASLTELGVDIVGSTPQEFAAYIDAEIPKWTAIVKASGAAVEH